MELANDLLHSQTKLSVGDVEAAAQSVRAAKYVLVSPGVVVLSEDLLTIKKGVLVREMDGHALLLFENNQ